MQKALDSEQGGVVGRKNVMLGTSQRLAAPVPFEEGGLQRPVRFVDRVRQAAGIGAFLVMGGVFTLIAWGIWLVHRRRIPEERGQRVLSGAFSLFLLVLQRLGCLVVDARGMGEVREARGEVIIANHPGLLDVALLVSHFPRATCVMRTSLMRNPVFRAGALLGGYVMNDSGPDMLRKGAQTVVRGGNLLVFPEGTRTGGGALDGFKPGFALIAVKTAAPVRTVLIESGGAALAKGSSLFAPICLPLRIKIRPGPVFRAAAGESARALAVRVETWYRAQLVRCGGQIRISGTEEA